MSGPVAREATRRRLTAKQADTVERLGRSAVGVPSREGFAGLTIRMVAGEAGVGADSDVVESLELLYAGVLMRAGTGYASYQSIADLLERSALMLLDRRT